ncbi:MAG: PDZ domain-containing protein [Gammaproteobacteria bacterium]|nr:PDZ domain-containing protein [Gammaproteobacteria bacterium]MBT8109293.1 PDZ domain-containing protein [Gammaproteobacteria bacterium]NND47766.1 PDZ domain-containing protein [Woeseiaceae bacterium]NNL43995.1 PDZ domain-containing protein [Woeseiaceae bacterium]
MSRIIAAIAISLIAGFAAAVWLMRDGPDDGAKIPADVTASNFEAAAPIEERLFRLEQVTTEEREARLVLEDQLQALIEEIERIDASGSRAFTDRVGETDDTLSRRQPEQRARRDFVSMVRNFQERRLNELVDGGFSEDEARRVLKQESEAQFKAMQAAHDAQRRGEEVDTLSAMSSPQALLRAELGDSDYERYLQAQGQATSIQVTRVLDSSPASQAGLQPGDQIVSYDGERVFDVNELRELTLQGRAGEDVVIEIERDGVRMQLSVPRGPVGINGTGAGVRRMNWWGGG